MSSGGPDRDVTVDLIAVETAEADGDDIVVERHSRTRATARRRSIAIAAAAVAIVAVGIALAVTRGDGGNDVAAREAQTPTTAAATVATTTAAVATSAAVDVAPSVPAPVRPGPTAPPIVIAEEPAPEVGLGTPVSFEATIDPARATVAAGTPVTVTLRVRNDGGETLRYEYDNDGCDPALVASGDIICTEAIRTLDVAPGSVASKEITIGTDGAPPNDYTVAIGDRVVLITIV